MVLAAISADAVDLKNRTTLDDTLDVFPCHGVDGIVGMVLTAIFAKEGGLATTGSYTLLPHHHGVTYCGVRPIRCRQRLSGHIR